MSESSAAEERRQIRKAFGDRAVAAFDAHAEAIAQLSADCREAFQQHKDMIEQLRDRMMAFEQARDDLSAVLNWVRESFYDEKGISEEDILRLAHGPRH